MKGLRRNTPQRGTSKTVFEVSASPFILHLHAICNKTKSEVDMKYLKVNLWSKTDNKFSELWSLQFLEFPWKIVLVKFQATIRCIFSFWNLQKGLYT